MAIYQRKAETKVTLPNWVIALVAVTLILVVAVLLIKYYPIIITWLQ